MRIATFDMNGVKGRNHADGRARGLEAEGCGPGVASVSLPNGQPAQA
jgi:hypothetical protein